MSEGTRTLVLMRHAKSDYPDGVSDHRRPLAPRGEREAALAGDWLRASVPEIDAVLCSSATRTRQTLERTGITAAATFSDRLYEASPGIVIEEINGVSDDVGTLLVVGHEPVMSSLALGLATETSAHSDAAQRISAKYPTSAIAVLRSDAPWAQLELGSAELVDFHIPR
ncbi:histidine phosphatase family protein [Mycolicibacterium sp. 018/SC-01/001]|uniref:SixA phosphatase family protein n=1 Tax=Mycolicibacterium sp. 018/SC-01/001 TaxID=2592069 RepID=UPI001180BA03|nr:histidine phosphatase family protein [Mycolicibacterium sp. 018/SC-01/001]TRW80916.1 histidine phosphatase family protein [Mycolicibacterium sp. 018/SC-01/001]